MGRFYGYSPLKLCNQILIIVVVKVGFNSTVFRRRHRGHAHELALRSLATAECARHRLKNRTVCDQCHQHLANAPPTTQ
jgi:hypothetical protein